MRVIIATQLLLSWKSAQDCLLLAFQMRHFGNYPRPEHSYSNDRPGPSAGHKSIKRPIKDRAFSALIVVFKAVSSLIDKCERLSIYKIPAAPSR